MSAKFGQNYFNSSGDVTSITLTNIDLSLHLNLSVSRFTSKRRFFSPCSVSFSSGSTIFLLAAGIRWKMLMIAAQVFSSCQNK